MRHMHARIVMAMHAYTAVQLTPAMQVGGALAPAALSAALLMHHSCLGGTSKPMQHFSIEAYQAGFVSAEKASCWLCVSAVDPVHNCTLGSS